MNKALSAKSVGKKFILLKSAITIIRLLDTAGSYLDTAVIAAPLPTIEAESIGTDFMLVYPSVLDNTTDSEKISIDIINPNNYETVVQIFTKVNSGIATLKVPPLHASQVCKQYVCSKADPHAVPCF